MKTTLYACYDFKKSPITFDICNFLCLAEAHRLEHGFDRLHLVTVPGPHQGFRDKGVVSDESKQWRLRNIINDCAWLVPSCQNVTNFYSREEANIFLNRMGACTFPEGYDVLSSPIPKYNWKHINNASDQGKDLQFLSAGPEAKKIIGRWLKKTAGLKKVVTVTLRQTEYETARNSNVDQWEHFLSSLDQNIYFPVIVPDFDYGFSSSDCFSNEICVLPHVVWDVELRSALYEMSYLNFFINNGTTTLGYFNRKVNLIIMKWVVEEVRVTSSSFLLDEMGFKAGQTPKFFGKLQKLCWEDDVVENIDREFKIMVEKIETSKQNDFEQISSTAPV